jgi:hypothetical protein
MNPLEALKELQVKPINESRKPVAIIIKGDQISNNPTKKLRQENPTRQERQEKQEKQVKFQDQGIDIEQAEPEPNRFEKQAPMTITLQQDKTFNRDALLKKFAESKLSKVSIKPMLQSALEAEKATELPQPITEPVPEIKKAKKVGKKQKLIIQDEEDEGEANDNNIQQLLNQEAIPLEQMDEPETIAVKAPKAPRKPKQIEKGIAVIGPETTVIIGDTPIVERLPLKTSPVNIKVSSYYLNNREYFINFINSLFEPYRQELEENSENISCDNIGNQSENFSLLTHQQIVRDYMNLYTPYHGLLLYHGLGSGKSCTSIAIAEGMKTTKKIVIMLPASLQTNYREELKKCGDSMYKKNQFWEWISIEQNPEATPVLSALLELPIEYIKRKKGAWFVNIKKPPNFSELTPIDQKSLNDQLNEMINSKYLFINYNGLRIKRLQELTSDFTKNLFDDKVVIIDEAHNLISRIVNKIKKEKNIEEDEKTGEKITSPKYLAVKLYEYLLSAKNARIVLLSGTPVINYPNEFGILFNILRGYIKTWEIPLDIKTSKKIDKNTLQDMLLGEKTLDYLDYSPSSKMLTITRNPFGFKNKIKKDAGYQGVSNTKKDDSTGSNVIDSDFITDADFERKIINALRKNDIEVLPVGIKVRNKKALPDSLELFNGNYIDPTTLELKNSDALKRRIIGLSSYFRSAQESLLPRYTNTLGLDYHVVRIPMSNYQFQKYEIARIEERKSEKKRRAPVPMANSVYEDKEQSSTYRIFSRLFCNFVMPNRPMPGKSMFGDGDEVEILKEGEGQGEGQGEGEGQGQGEKENTITKLIEQARKAELNIDINNDKEGEIEADEILDEIGGVDYKARVDRALNYIKDHSNEFLTPEALETYSPKFLSILDNINDPRHLGLHLIYSQFRTIEGIGIFSLVLEKNGFARFKIKKTTAGWELNMSPDDFGKPTFALYTGTESTEEKEIIRNIYNGDWDYVDSGIKNELTKIAHNNNMGEIIKVFMITSSGSEGINLRNTRYIHIMEPYWHPVRLEQVIGRAKRICSHKGLPEALRTVEVFVYLMIFTAEQLKSDASIELKKHDKSKKAPYVPITSDQYLYEISEIKSNLTKQLTDVIKESSFDCYIYNGKNCVNFGDPNKNDFSYVPDYSSQQNDTTLKTNKKAIEWQGKIVTIGTRRYIYRRMSPTLLNIYDEQSYMDALTNPNVVVRQVGTLEIDKNGNEVFKQLVT